jgi:carbonic anhydrase
MQFSHPAVPAVTTRPALPAGARWNTRRVPKPSDTARAHPSGPDEALSLLIEGNRRHQSGRVELHDYSPVGDDHANRQMPFAAIISCADSRVSPTLIFDVDRGNLFSSKVAGNTIDSGTLGSTEFAVKVLGVKLVMVLGHSNCGAVTAAVEVANGESSYPPDEYGAIGEVVDRIVPSVESVPPADRTTENCVRANAAAQAADIAGKAPIINKALAAGQIAVVAAVYNIKNGKVSLI